MQVSVPEPSTPGPTEPTAEERRRRLERVFGTLPEQTSDDLDEADPATSGEHADDWWRQQVPPHHGG